MRVLDFVRSHRRVAVRGGAGTGKTVLALEKARRLSDEGFRTLLTCYNRQLADHLASLCAGTANLDVMGFHQLGRRQVERANRESGRDLLAAAKVTYPGKNLYDVQLPNALAYSARLHPWSGTTAIIRASGRTFATDPDLGAQFELHINQTDGRPQIPDRSESSPLKRIPRSRRARSRSKGSRSDHKLQERRAGFMRRSVHAAGGACRFLRPTPRARFRASIRLGAQEAWRHKCGLGRHTGVRSGVDSTWWHQLGCGASPGPSPVHHRGCWAGGQLGMRLRPGSMSLPLADEAGLTVR